MNPEILAIIPARGGSKGIPRKNLKELAGVPLIVHTIEAAANSRLITRAVVSTEDDEIAWTVWEYGAETVTIPKELATDSSPLDPVLEYTVEHLKTEGYEPDIIVLLQPTSPLRTSAHIDEALGKFLASDCDSALSVCNSRAFIWRTGLGAAYPVNCKLKRQLRQERRPEYKENGAIYITKRRILLKQHNRLGGRIGLYVMREENSPEIDTEFDFWLCEAILEANKKFL